MVALDRFGRSHSGLTRRDVLRSGLAAGAVAGLGDLGFLSGLTPVSADEAKLAAAWIVSTRRSVSRRITSISRRSFEPK